MLLVEVETLRRSQTAVSSAHNIQLTAEAYGSSNQRRQKMPSESALLSVLVAGRTAL